MTNKAKRIVIIQGHPDPDGNHFCHALAKAYVDGVAAAGQEINIVDVARLDFPFLRSRDDQRGEPPPVIRETQSAIIRADHVMMIYPLWNGGAPALLKAFLEQTLRPAFIFPEIEATGALGLFSYFSQRKALKGKTARVVVTMQMPAFVYRWYFRPHPEKNTLRVSGLKPVAESLIGGVEARNGRKRERWLRRMRELGRAGQ